MHQTAVPSAVWQRRTNKIIAAGITIIGLTMMLSLIPQCIYIGVVFVACALVWLGWMTMKEKKAEPPRPEGQHPTSPVLFLVASHHLRQSSRGPTLADPDDKPPSYEQILKLDGLPPDYYSVLAEKPPRYEDLSPTLADPDDKPPSYEQILKLDGLPPDYYSVLAEKPPRYEDLSPTLGWGACALPVEYYADLPCVHLSSSPSSPPDSPVSLEVPTDSSTAFLPSSWSAQSVLPTSFQPSAFGTENPAFSTQSLNVGEECEEKEVSESTQAEGERREDEKEEERKVPVDSNV